MQPFDRRYFAKMKKPPLVTKIIPKSHHSQGVNVRAVIYPDVNATTPPFSELFGHCFRPLVQFKRNQQSLSTKMPRLFTANPFTMASSTALSTRLLRKSIPLQPGRYSTFSSMARTSLAGIPHPSTYIIKPMDEPLTFESPSRPRMMYTRPVLRPRELPPTQVRERSLNIGRQLLVLVTSFLSSFAADHMTFFIYPFF